MKGEFIHFQQLYEWYLLMGEERFLGYIESYGELYASFSCKYNYWCMFDKSGKIVSNGTIEQYSHNAYDLYTLHRLKSLLTFS